MLESGNELVVSTWDIISGDVKPGADVLLFDDAGDHAALQAAEIIAAAGARLEIMTPDRTFAPEVMAMNLVPYMRSLQKRDVTFTVTFRLEAVATRRRRIAGRPSAATTAACARSGASIRWWSTTARCPMDELYFALKPQSRNLGAVDHDRLIAGQPQSIAAQSARAVSSSFESATPWPRATPMPRSTMP